MPVCETDQDGCVRVTVVSFGQRRCVRLPRRDRSYTVEEILVEAGIPSWERCELRRNGYTVTTTEVVEDGHVIYVLTKIKGNMPVHEEPEHRFTVLVDGRRLTVTLPFRAERYTVEEVLVEARIERCLYVIRRDGVTICHTDRLESGHVLELTRISDCGCTERERVCEERVCGGEWVNMTVVSFGRRYNVRLPRRVPSYTVEEVLRSAGLSSWERCEFRRNGYTVTTTEFVEDGHVIYVLTKIKGN